MFAYLQNTLPRQTSFSVVWVSRTRGRWTRWSTSCPRTSAQTGPTSPWDAWIRSSPAARLSADTRHVSTLDINTYLLIAATVIFRSKDPILLTGLLDWLDRTRPAGGAATSCSPTTTSKASPSRCQTLRRRCRGGTATTRGECCCPTSPRTRAVRTAARTSGSHCIICREVSLTHSCAG